MRLGILVAVTLLGVTAAHAQPGGETKGIRLEDLAWQQAEKILTPDAVVVIPLGAASKEHGPHLKLRNDLTLANYFAGRVLEAATIVMAPTVTYSFYPAFVEYPGSTTLRLETARDMVVDICRSLAAYGPRRFYVLNTGVSTVRALRPAAEMLASDGIVMRFTELDKALGDVEKRVLKQEGGTHADEGETSMMLVIDPASVDMTKAVKDYHPQGPGGLSRTQGSGKTYSPTGSWGDPTLATREKGEALVAGMVAAVLNDIEELRAAPLPAR